MATFSSSAHKKSRRSSPVGAAELIGPFLAGAATGGWWSRRRAVHQAVAQAVADVEARAEATAAGGHVIIGRIGAGRDDDHYSSGVDDLDAEFFHHPATGPAVRGGRAPHGLPNGGPGDVGARLSRAVGDGRPIAYPRQDRGQRVGPPPPPRELG